MGRPPKNPDAVLNNQDVEPTELTDQEQTLVHTQQENQTLRESVGMLMDRLNRLESIQNQNKLRKYDEIHDPESQRKTGRVPSMDGKDPIVSIVKKGSSWIDEHSISHDEQSLTVTTANGVTKTFDLLQFNAACSGNSIPCVVNDWEELMNKQQMLSKKYHEFQRSTGQTARVNTVALLKEIKEMEGTITVNVTLSEDYGKTFEGKTLDIPWQNVFNAIA